MSRYLRSAIGVAALATTIGLAGCSGSSGTKVQDGPSSPASTTTGTPSGSGSGGDPTPTSPSSSSYIPPAPYGDAAPAVAAYLKINDQYNAALMNPAKFSPAIFQNSTAGRAKLVLVGSIQDEKKNGLAYRGTPDQSRVQVTSVKLTGALPIVQLTDCPRPSSTWVEYNTATGKAAPAGATPKVPPPYLAKITMVQPNRKAWVFTSVTLDGSKTCSR
jgi:hypothetical protein